MADSPNNPDDFSASDVLAPGFWAATESRSTVGVDVACTKIVVDLQTMTQASAESTLHSALTTLRASAAVDSAFLLLLANDGETVQTVYAKQAALVQGRIEAMRGDSLQQYPWLRGRTDHLQLSELRDCVQPHKDQQAEARRFLELQLGSVLVVAIRVQGKPAGLLGFGTTLPRGAWDVNLRLLLKLVGTSIASALERIALAISLAALEERVEMSDRKSVV